MKSLFVNSDEVKGISVADPKFYQERFKRFIYDKVLTCQDNEVNEQEEFLNLLKE